MTAAGSYEPRSWLTEWILAKTSVELVFEKEVVYEVEEVEQGSAHHM